ncbi:MAG: hypothetical protein ACXQT1_02130 [Methermicoccaceae archaeon]
MWWKEGDIECIRALLKPAKRVNGIDGPTLDAESTDKRVEWWNEIKQNLGQYLDGKCGQFYDTLDNAHKAELYLALLRLASSFQRKAEDFPPAEMFSERELMALEKLERFNAFDILTPDDVERRLVSGDRNMAELLSEYYTALRGQVDGMLDEPEIKLPVRAALKKIAERRVGVLEDSLKQAFDVGWVRKLLEESDAEVEQKVQELTEEQDAALDEERVGIAQERAAIEREKETMESERREKEGLERRREQLLQRAKDTGRLVRKDEASAMELSFMERIEKRLNSDKLVLGGVSYKRKGSVQRDEKSLEAALSEKKHWKAKQLSVYAVFASHEQSYTEYGIDPDPLELGEVTDLLKRHLTPPKKDNARRVLCIGSPTGFEEKARAFISSDEFHRTFASGNLSVSLLDLETGELIFNSPDECASLMKDLFELEFDEEKLERTKRCIRTALAERDHISVEKTAELCDVGEDMAKRAFYALKPEFTVSYIEEVGLVIMRS